MLYFKRKIQLIFLVIGLCTPIIFVLLYIKRYGVNCIYWDDWWLVDFIDKIYNNNLRFLDLFLPHTQHIIFFPRLLMILLALITKYNIIAELIVIFLIIFSVFIILFFYYKKNNIDLYKLFFFIPVSFMIFNFRQSENFLWGWQITFLFPLLFSLLSFYFIDCSSKSLTEKYKFIYFTLAILAAVISSFSGAQGILVWFAGSIQIFITKFKNKIEQIIFFGVYLIFGVINVYFYLKLLILLNNPDYGGIDFSFINNNIKNVLLIFKKFLYLIVNSLYNVAYINSFLVFLISILLLILIFLIISLAVKFRRVNHNAFMVAVLIFSLLTVLFLCLGGRKPNLSRYTSYTIYLIISSYIILTDIYFNIKKRFIFSIVIFFIIILTISLPFSIVNAIVDGKHNSMLKKHYSFLLYNYKIQPEDVLKQICHWGENRVIKYAPLLEHLGYNVFSKKDNIKNLENMKLVGSEIILNIDEISFNYTFDPKIKPYDKNVIKKDKNYLITPYSDEAFLKISGWVIDNSLSSINSKIYIEVDNKLYPAYYGFERKDVVNKFNNNYINDGFIIYLPFKEIGKGKHNIYLCIVYSDNREYKKKLIFSIQLLGSLGLEEINFDNLVQDESRYQINVDVYDPSEEISGFKDISGWVIDRKKYDYSNLTILIVNGQEVNKKNIIGVADYYINREDVVKFFNKKEYIFSGFTYQLDSTKFNNGYNDVCIFAINEEGIYSKKCYRYFVKN